MENIKRTSSKQMFFFQGNIIFGCKITSLFLPIQKTCFFIFQSITLCWMPSFLYLIQNIVAHMYIIIIFNNFIIFIHRYSYFLFSLLLFVVVLYFRLYSIKRYTIMSCNNNCISLMLQTSSITSSSSSSDTMTLKTFFSNMLC